MKKIFLGGMMGMLMLLALPAMASATVVYDALPNPLPPNASSQPFQAQQTFEFGDYVHLGGTDRNLTTVVVAMSNWALASTPANVTFCAENSTKCTAEGYIHPITINIYSNQLGANGVPNDLLASKTQDIFVPWRPAADLSCDGGTAWKASNGTCYNGLAFNAVFDLSSLNVVLPNDVIVSLAYNTQTWGAVPIGKDGPYNSLNVLVPNNQTVTVGTDDNVGEVFWNTATAGYYADSGTGGVNVFRKDTNWIPNGTVAMQINATSPAPAIVKVTINKFVDGKQATSVSANDSAFPMSATWNAVNIGAGSGSYDLDADGFNGNPTPYQAITSDMTSGASYSTSEVTTGSTVGNACSENKPYALVGYSSGDTLEEAQSASPTSTVPSFTDLKNDKFVIVWNKICVPTPTHVSPANDSTLTSSALTRIDWSDVTDPADGITYVYQSSNSSSLNSDGSFVSPVYTSGVLSVSEIPTLGTPEGIYYWHVKAVDADGNESAWSDAWKVTVDNAPSPALTTPVNKDQCKNDGWKTLVDRIGNNFKNQGDCVSFVATKEKNTAAVIKKK